MNGARFKTHICSYVTTLVICFAISNLAHAHTPATLTQLIEEAQSNNPQIKAARNNWEAMQYVIPQSRSLPDPKIEAGYTNMAENITTNADPTGEQMLGISQEIPFPGKLIVKGQIATLEARQAEEEYRAISLAVIAELKRIYYELYFVNKSIEILQKNRQLLEQMEKSTEANYSVGKNPQQDIFRAQTEVSRIQMRLIMLKQERTSLQANINRLLNRALNITIKTPAKLPVTVINNDFKHFQQLIEQQSPQLRAQKINVEKGKTAIKLSKMDYFPDIEIEGGGLRDTKMHTKGYQVLVKVTFPLYFMYKQNNSVRESIARHSADVEDLYTTLQTLSFEMENALLLAQRSKQLIQLIQYTIIPQATLTFNSSQSSYSVGKVDFLTMLNNLLMLQDNELELHNEIVQHEKAIATIEQIIGTFL
jgi:outer membrane protein, heavy metal efflux system